MYGAGALLYELVTGVPPYAGSREALERKKQSPPQSPRLFRPDLSPEIEQLLLRLLDPDPAQRPPSIAELSSELATLAEQAGPGDIDVPTPRDEERRRQRREAAFRAIAELAVGVHRRPASCSSPCSPARAAARAGPIAGRPARRRCHAGAGGNLAAAGRPPCPAGWPRRRPLPMGRGAQRAGHPHLGAGAAGAQPGRGPAARTGCSAAACCPATACHPADAGQRRVRTMVLAALVPAAAPASAAALAAAGSSEAAAPAAAATRRSPAAGERRPREVATLARRLSRG